MVGRPLLCFGCSSAYVLPQCLRCCPFVRRGAATSAASNTSRRLLQRHSNPLTRLCPVFVGHHNHSYGALWAPSYVALVSMSIVIIDIVAFCALRARQRSTDFVYGVGAVLYVALAALLTLIGLAKTNVQTVLEGVCGPWPRLRGADPRRTGCLSCSGPRVCGGALVQDSDSSHPIHHRDGHQADHCLKLHYGPVHGHSDPCAACAR